MIKKISWTIAILFGFKLIIDSMNPASVPNFLALLSFFGTWIGVFLLGFLPFIYFGFEKQSKVQVSQNGKTKHQWLRLVGYIFLALIASLVFLVFIFSFV
jgi:hypothetical protein